MALPLKYNTASQTIIIGPFLDSTDGVTAETGLTIANTDIKLIKHGGTSTTNKNSGGATHIANGYYYATLNASDTDTVGRLNIYCTMSGACPVWHEFVVLPAVVFDSLYAGTDTLQVDVTQISGSNVSTSSAQLGVNLVNIAGSAVSTSTAQLGVNVVNAGGTAWGSGAITAGSIASNAITDAKINSGAITAAKFASGAIDAAALATDAANEIGTAVWATAARTLTAATNITSTGGTITLDGSGYVTYSNAAPPTAAAIADAVWDETSTGHTDTGKAGAKIWTDIPAILDDTGTSGVVVASINNNAITAAAIATGAIDADALASDAVTEIWSGSTAPSASAIADAVWDEARADHTSSGTFGQGAASVQGNVTGSVGSISGVTFPTNFADLAITSSTGRVTVGTNADKTGYSISGTKQTLDALNDITAAAVWSAATRTLTSAANITSTGGTTVPQTGDAYARLGAPAGASVSADIAAIKAETASILTDTAEIGTAGAGLTAIPWNSSWDAEVQSEVFDALDAAFTDATSLTSNGLLDRIRTLGWILRNKITVADATGNTVIYKDDSTTPAFSVNAMLTDDSTTTTRLRAA